MLETRGYNVICCSKAEEALKYFASGHVDLVLTDLIMPDMDGADLIRKMKEINPDVPAIIFSGKIKMYDKDMPANIFLPKGVFAPAELLERIRLLLVRKRGPKKAVRREEKHDLVAV